MSVSTPFARILAAGRTQFNARVAEAKRRSPSFDSDAFGAFLISAVDPVIAAVDAISPDRAASVALSAYDIALMLAAQGMIGPKARYPLVGRAWGTLFPALAQQISEEPAEVLGALSNAALYLGSTPNLRGEEWLQHMCELAPTTTVPELLALGKVLAWRSGVAHFRSGALNAASTLPENLVVAAVGATPGNSWASIRARFDDDPWWSPNAEVASERCIGDFSGFGGSFSQPPEVRASVSGFWVKSGDRYSLLIADVWGAVLHPASAEEFASPAPIIKFPVPVQKGNRLIFGHRAVDIDLPAEGLSVVCNETTAAVSSIYSHQIRLYPLQ
ncbi:MAG: hypothetical protein L6Q60_11805 [Rhodocyclaceae bacterium]|nr:hypothetical protein [Rhodocyclaceae bacterium]